MDIKLNDLLMFDSYTIDNVKIKFCQASPTDNPLELYKKEPDIVNSTWLLWNEEKKYFREGLIAVCFLKLTWDTWLLTTIKKITKELNVKNGVNYEAEELDQYKKYFGRVIVKYHKKAPTQGFYYKKICDDIIVNQILPTTFDGFDFPGYDNVCLSFEQLETIILQNKKDWVAALKNQKAVYLITDKNSGKLYVGSATSDKGMLLQRWSSYVSNGHGGNVQLKALVLEKGMEYVRQNFQYSILENYNAKVDDHIILERESWWKKVLLSRVHGYNSN